MTDLEHILNGLAFLVLNTEEYEGSLQWQSRKLNASLRGAPINADGVVCASLVIPPPNGASLQEQKQKKPLSAKRCCLRLVAADPATN